MTGSHVKFAKRTMTGLRTTIVPKHWEVAVGTLRSILRQAGISPKDFDKLSADFSRAFQRGGG